MSALVRPPLRLPNLLVKNRNFVLLWLAYGVAALGDHLSEMALLKERHGLDPNRPDATRVQALISFGFFLPFVVLGPLAGWWSDRFSRRSTMIAADLLRAAVVFNMAFIVAALERWLDPTGTDPYNLRDFAIVIPLCCVGALAAFFSPARQAMLPTLIRDDQLVRANAMISALGTIGTILSAALGGYLVQHVGPEWNYHINALTFTLSAVFVSCILMSRTRAVPHPPLEGVWAPVVAGFRYVTGHRRVLQMIMLGAVFWGSAGIVVSVVPTIVKGYFGENYTAAGNFRALIGAGLAVGAAVMTLIGPAMPLQLAVLIGLAGAGVWALALDAAYVFRLGTVATGLCLFGIGGAGASLLVTIMAAIQHVVPDSRRGRVFGVSDMATMGAMVLTSGALGLLPIPNLDRYIPLLLLAISVAMFGALVLAWREYRRGDPIRWYTSLIRKFTTFHAHFWFRLKRRGPCTVPRTGPVILAANHTAGVDPLAMIVTCPHRMIGFIVAQEYYRPPLAGWFMRQVDCIPIDRANPGKSFLTAALRTLKDGRCLGIFPEGTFVAPGEPPPEVKPGVGLLALRTGAPVIPCHISGTRYSDNPFVALFRRHRVRIRYGPPVDLSAFRGREKDKDAPQEASALIMQKILELAPGPEDDEAAAR